jgi:flagellar protein FlgJ
MYDQQLALLLARRGGQGPAEGMAQGLGLADALVRQLGGAAAANAARTGSTIAGPEAFVRALHAPASDAGRALGVAPEALLAQAALETGWGRHVPAGPDGRPSYNLFGIKADARWHGARVAVPTVEYRDGVAERSHETFRAYGSYEESFRDYVRFVQDNPRYRAALAARADSGDYLAGLAQAGYATDPAYAAKLERVLSGDALRGALAALKSGDARPLT